MIKNVKFDKRHNEYRTFIYKYDSYGNRVFANKKLYDSIFENNKLIAIKDSNAIKVLFEYDKKGRLRKETNYAEKYRPVRKIKLWKEYKYKKDAVIEYYYSSEHWSRYKTVILTYNKQNKLINMSVFTKVDQRFYKWYSLNKPIDYYCINNFTYENNRLVLMEQKCFSGDNGIDECDMNYKEIYKYEY